MPTETPLSLPLGQDWEIAFAGADLLTAEFRLGTRAGQFLKLTLSDGIAIADGGYLITVGEDDQADLTAYVYSYEIWADGALLQYGSLDAWGTLRGSTNEPEENALGGVAAGTGTVAADLTVAQDHQLGGSSAGAGDAAGSLDVGVSLAGGAAGEGAATGNLSVDGQVILAGQSDGVGDGSGELVNQGPPRKGIIIWQEQSNGEGAQNSDGALNPPEVFVAERWADQVFVLDMLTDGPTGETIIASSEPVPAPKRSLVTDALCAGPQTHLMVGLMDHSVDIWGFQWDALVTVPTPKGGQSWDSEWDIAEPYVFNDVSYEAVPGVGSWREGGALTTLTDAAVAFIRTLAGWEDAEVCVIAGFSGENGGGELTYDEHLDAMQTFVEARKAEHAAYLAEPCITLARDRSYEYAGPTQAATRHIGTAQRALSERVPYAAGASTNPAGPFSADGGSGIHLMGVTHQESAYEMARLAVLAATRTAAIPLPTRLLDGLTAPLIAYSPNRVLLTSFAGNSIMLVARASTGWVPANCPMDGDYPDMNAMLAWGEEVRAVNVDQSGNGRTAQQTTDAGINAALWPVLISSTGSVAYWGKRHFLDCDSKVTFYAGYAPPAGSRGLFTTFKNGTLGRSIFNSSTVALALSATTGDYLVRPASTVAFAAAANKCHVVVTDPTTGLEGLRLDGAAVDAGVGTSVTSTTAGNFSVGGRVAGGTLGSTRQGLHTGWLGEAIIMPPATTGGDIAAYEAGTIEHWLEDSDFY